MRFLPSHALNNFRGQNGVWVTMTGASEWQRLLAGSLYQATDPELVSDHLHVQNLLYRFNATRADTADERLALLMELFCHFGRGSVLKPPFRCDYGYNILIGRNVFVNYDCVFLDCNRIVDRRRRADRARGSDL
jgi:hypothetical protein